MNARPHVRVRWGPRKMLFCGANTGSPQNAILWGLIRGPRKMSFCGVNENNEKQQITTIFPQGTSAYAGGYLYGAFRRRTGYLLQHGGRYNHGVLKNSVFRNT